MQQRSAPAAAETVAEKLDEIATEIKINSVVNRRFELDRRNEARRKALAKGFDVDVPMKAGPRAIAVTFLKHTSAKGEALIRPRLRGRGQLPAIASVTIRGPQKISGAGDTPSRRRIFICTPAEAGCAKKILSSLARRAYRRPVSEADLQPLLSIYEAERSESGFEAGIKQGLERILVSPQFLFRIERQPAKVAAGSVYRISDLELASRLSFFLWSSIPDEELLELAVRGKLSNRTVLDQQVRRMLRDSRSEALATNFAAQWLYLRDVHAKTPSPRLFPDFDLSLRDAFERETTLFLESVFREDRSVIDLLRSNDTFMNERLAKHYGVPNVLGNNFRRVTYPEDNPRRGLGLLGHSSILTLTSYANRTSPVLRGKYVLGNLLGAPPAPPPPNIPALATENKESGKVLPMREALAQHRANPACAGCHAAMDPIGFAMDNFDALGRWRTVDASGATIDPSGVLPDGTRFEGVAGLRQVLLSHPERFVSTLTENLLAYAVGRSLEYYDQPVSTDGGARFRAPGLSFLRAGSRHRKQPRLSEQEGRGAADRDRGGTALRRRRIMIITKRALPRRTFLRGMGATVALPFLDAMVPALSARAAKPAVRLGFVYIPNGTIQPMWVPATTGKELRAVADSQPVDAGARSHHGVERTGAPTGGQPRRRQRRPCARHGRLADRCACMGPRPWRI